ncbi:MAG: S-methyl-5-thioribose-1-phosphate isomerase, partial [Alphaproteobacteria bacterium]|nr:S-methyl-5-thioribose-1-phosphate isomerase [Alphaproteobacteria bacterium]
MNVEGTPYRTIWLDADGWAVSIIDQTRLPHRFEIVRLETLADAAHAIKAMLVRGAPLIGVAAAYGMALALRADAGDAALDAAAHTLMATRPTAVNLRWAVEDLRRHLEPLPVGQRAAAAYARAAAMADEDVAINRAMGAHGLALIRAAQAKKGGAVVNVLTHCNAGWLATVDWGTALAPVFCAQEAGVPIHVWV